MDSDNEDGQSYVSDSEFGLSNWQLEALWLQFGAERKAGINNAFSVVHESNLTDEEDIEDGEALDADFGLCEKQLLYLQHRCTAAESPGGDSFSGLADAGDICINDEECETTIPEKPQPEVADPLKVFLKERRSTADSLEATCEDAPIVRSKSAKESESMIQEQLPVRRCRSERKYRPPSASPCGRRIQLVSWRRIEGVTWYLWQVDDKGHRRFYMKRYRDFVKLDRTLRSLLGHTISKIHSPLPQLPKSGTIGIRQYFDLGDFMAKRRGGLQRYLEVLHGMECFRALPFDHPLEEFFGAKGSGQVSQVALRAMAKARS